MPPNPRSESPKVSVVIPVYNVERYLRECLNSAIGQTLQDIEIICVNDGSKDHSLAILEEYAAKDPRIKIISKANSGYGHTMNTGIDHARGEFIGILESDDYLRLNMYEVLYAQAQEVGADFVKSNMTRFFGEGSRREFSDIPLTTNHSYYNRVIDPREEPTVFLLNMNNVTGIFRRDFLNRHNIRFHETPGASFQDVGFWFQTFSLASRVFFLNQAFYMIRRDNPNSSVADKSKVYCIGAEYQFIREFLDRNPAAKEHYKTFRTVKMFRDFLSNYRRVAEQHRIPWLQYFSEEIQRVVAEKEFDESLFTPVEKEQFLMIMGNPESFYFRDRISQQYQRYTALLAAKDREIHALTHSASFRIGRFITYLPRRIRVFVRKLRQEGAGAACRDACQEPGRLFKRFMAHTAIRKIRETIRRQGLFRTADLILIKTLMKKRGVTFLKRRQELIVSLTSFPPRIPTLHRCIQSLLEQRTRPDRVILWLADEQFPNREKDLPQNLLALRERGLSISWCDDLKPHKKYYQTMQQAPEAIVVTVDDDVEYDSDLLSDLMAAHGKHPRAVVCQCAREMKFTEDGTPHPYSEWNVAAPDKYRDKPEMLLLPIGVRGVLYPPHCLDARVFDQAKLKELALCADDLWLRIMGILHGTPVLLVAPRVSLRYIPTTQETALWKSNLAENKNDEYLKNLLDEYSDVKELLSRGQSNERGEE